jgi:hypothetical protein
VGSVMRSVHDIATAEGAELRQCGNTFRGLCLLHDRDGRNPSFQCGEDWFKCYACGASGDGIAFVMKLKNMSFPQALEYLGEEVKRPTLQDKAKLTRERKKREAAEWRERDLAWTLGTLIRRCNEILEKITPDTIDAFALILTELETLTYQHDLLINGSKDDKAALMADLKDFPVIKRGRLFREDFNYKAWLSIINRPEGKPAEPQHETKRIEISFG